VVGGDKDAGIIFKFDFVSVKKRLPIFSAGF
jgi:hypothetical protein